MTARSKSSITFMVLSILLLLSGITLTVLVYEMVRTAIDMADQMMEMRNEKTYIDPDTYTYSSSFSVLGVGYIVPAILGIIAFACHKKGAYIVHMVFSIIGLVVMGIFFVIGLFVLSAMATHKSMDCTTGPNGCMCRANSYSEYKEMGLRDCDVLYQVYNIAVAAVAFLTMNWILLLICTVLSGIEGCRSTQGQPGAVIIREVPQTTFVRLEETGAPPPVYAVHDQAVLVKNQ